MGCGKNHPRRADPALSAAVPQKGLLKKVELSVRSQALDGDDGGAVGLQRRHETTVHEVTVDQNRASAAFSLATTFFDARQAQVFAQNIQQARHRIRLYVMRLVVYTKLNRDFFSH